MRHYLIFTLCLLSGYAAFGQRTLPGFPQTQITQQLNPYRSPVDRKFTTAVADKSPGGKNTYQLLEKMEQVRKTDWGQYIPQQPQKSILDTVYVGAFNTDTLIITGQYNHEGPIFVFNQGVLIIHNANFTNEGDIYVFGNGQLLCDSSVLNFPQQYFYQRSLLVVQQGMAYFKDMSFNYSGMQHNLVMGDSAFVGMENVHQNDWTTAGLFGEATLYINGMNLGGEYILSDSTTSSFQHVDTLLLWHKFPSASVINHSFPQGNAVYNYYFSNLLGGISGVDYESYTDSCYTVWWGIMPVNGSDVTLSNSNIRVAGNWFQFGDSINASNIFNGTFYPNTLIPLPDRTLNLLNTFVQTWSFYVFDSSYVGIENCTLGEVGTQQRASVTAQNMLLDGSGGYFWATDTSTIFAVNITSYSTTRSERNGIFVLAYSDMPFAGPTATGNSLVVSVQNNTAADPLPYDGAIAWNQKIEQPSVAHTDSLVPVTGSAWVNQGPNGSWMDFASYSLYYQMLGDSTWNAIVIDSTVEVSHSVLGLWNTTGLTTGDYILRLKVTNNLGDSVDAFVAVNMLSGAITNITLKQMENKVCVFPVPASTRTYVRITLSIPDEINLMLCDITGRVADRLSTSYHLPAGTSEIMVDMKDLPPGTYQLNFSGNTLQYKCLVPKN